jgi:hypothetical protein
MKSKQQYVTPVRISQEENGYVLDVNFQSCGVPDERHVFQSFTELVNFLNEHFTYRNEIIFADYPNQSLINLKNNQ